MVFYKAQIGRAKIESQKKALAAISSLLLAASACVPLSASADSALLSTDKAAYTEGEAIMITAAGTGNDWVGIYKNGEMPGAAIQSIRWYYVAKDGNTSGKAKNIFESEYIVRQDLKNLPAGEYTIFLCENDGYTVLAQTGITINEKNTALVAPASAVYERNNRFTGSADGKLTITASKDAIPDSYAAFWGNAQGKLADYTSFPLIKAAGEVTTYTMVANTLIPNGADRILVYAARGKRLSETYATAMLPKGCNEYDFGKPLYEFQVFSDIHLSDNPATAAIHNEHFTSALKQVKQLSPNSKGIMINGDIADNGTVRQYELYQDLVEKAGFDLSQVRCAIGNHDFYGPGNDKQKLLTFLEYTNPDSKTIYFDEWIGGAHFIFLGSEKKGNGLHAYLSDEQLNWFREKLAEKRDENRPIYVFLHQGLIDTVAGTYEYQGWHGIDRAEEFAAILKDYPEVILFSGHSHWEMNSASNMKERDENLPTIFNTASVAYLWSDAQATIEGAQGYFVKVYKDKVLVLGRDFDNEQWLASAQYLVQYGSESPVEPEKPDSSVSPEPQPTTPTTEQTNTASDAASPTTGDSGLLYVMAIVAAGLASAGLYFLRKTNKTSVTSE